VDGKPGTGILAGLAFVAACTGDISDPGALNAGTDSPGTPGSNPTGSGGSTTMGGSGQPAELPGIGLTPATGLRRLSSREYDATLRDLLGDTTTGSNQLLPTDLRTPFDNDYRTQEQASAALIEGLELLAKDASARLLADTGRRDGVVGCKPATPADQACFRSFVTSFGRRALRRALESDEIQTFAAPLGQAQTMDDFYAAVDIVVRALLQHPEFVHRVEIGTPVSGQPGVVRLGHYEMASRLSYLLWGSMPDDALLDRAAAGRLGTPSDVRAAAEAMLESPRASQGIARFHAMWMGYDQLPHGKDLASAMQEESNALVTRVIFERKAPWHDLLRSTETFISDLLARHYGMPLPGSSTPRWVAYPAGSPRRGILSHGGVLSNGAKAQDTSPVMRGKFVRERLFCEPPLEVPANLNVNVDEPPAGSGSPCKWDRYAEHRQGGCAGCHALLDGVGFGLENYDTQGRFRALDRDTQKGSPTLGQDLPQCQISGEGDVVGVGKFNGPGGLGDLMIQAGLFRDCGIKQFYRFAIGRAELDHVDDQAIVALASRAGTGDFRFDQILLDLVSAPAFGYRREDK
jgi:hypothetical protein